VNEEREDAPTNNELGATPPKADETTPTIETGESDGTTTEAQSDKPDSSAEDQLPAELVVDIPGRRPGDKPIKLAMEDKETADLVRAALKDRMRRKEFNRQMKAVNREREEIDVLEQCLELDPVSFLVERVRPEIQTDLVRRLLLIPAVFAALRNDVTELETSADARARWRSDAAETLFKRQRASDRASEQRSLRTADDEPDVPVPATTRPARIVKAKRVG
jgi:hypothetical protein